MPAGGVLSERGREALADRTSPTPSGRPQRTTEAPPSAAQAGAEGRERSPSRAYRSEGPREQQECSMPGIANGEQFQCSAGIEQMRAGRSTDGVGLASDRKRP